MLCLSRHSAILRGKKQWTLRANLFYLFIPARLIGIIDFCHLMLLSVTLSLPAGHNDSTMQNLLASISCTIFFI